MAHRITIDVIDDQVRLQFGNAPDAEPMTAKDVEPMLMSAYEAVISRVLDEIKRNVSEDQQEAVYRGTYEHLVLVFDAFLQKLFPNMNQTGFDFTDAALIYAQDQIIKEAEQKGISFEDAIKNYEKKAQEYIAERITRKS